VFGPDRAVWFTAQNSNLIGRLDRDTGKISEFSVPTQNAQPYGIVSASDGGLWFCELEGQKLGRVDPESGVMAEFTPGDSNVHPRRLVAVGGAIYFTDWKGGRLGRMTLADKQFKLWNSPSGKDSEPDGIAADETGKIWYVESEEGANKLVRFDPAAEVFNVFPLPVPAASVGDIGEMHAVACGCRSPRLTRYWWLSSAVSSSGKAVAVGLSFRFPAVQVAYV